MVNEFKSVLNVVKLEQFFIFFFVCLFAILKRFMNILSESDYEWIFFMFIYLSVFKTVGKKCIEPIKSQLFTILQPRSTVLNLLSHGPRVCQYRYRLKIIDVTLKLLL